MSSTEAEMRDWRYGSTHAERLAAVLLHLERFVEVDPQHPLGGQDGIKDVLCRRGGVSFVAAVYFPPIPPRFSQIRAKFAADLEGVAKNGAGGFVFFVNQRLTVSERAELLELAPGIQVEIYHLERMRDLLDSPRGCGIRLEYLRIAMTPEEQIAFWSEANVDLHTTLAAIAARQEQMFGLLTGSMDSLMRRTIDIQRGLQIGRSSALGHVEKFDGDFVTRRLDAGLVRWLYRLVMAATASSVREEDFRSVNVFVRSATGDEPAFIPPVPAELDALVDVWASAWRDNYDAVLAGTREAKVDALTSFYHEFLRIHPFLDGNGRVGLALLDQAARELLGRSVSEQLLRDPLDHQAALVAADKGDLEPLRRRVAAALE